MTRIANEIVLDYVKYKIYIEGLEFPFRVEADPEIEAAVGGGMGIVHLGIFANNIRLIHAVQAEAPVIASLDVELAWARERGREIVRDGLADIIAQLRPQRG